METIGLFGTLERGTFADIKRSRTGGKGLAGVVMKDEYYFNPFVELMKGSLNTFLNALTASDWTVYPVASQNMQDYLNLVDVYMDAVLNPLIHSVPEIFWQEGWHYEINDGKLSVNGVVYNEMKGALSSPDRVIMQETNTALFDNTYGVNSGGDPAVIIEVQHPIGAHTHQIGKGGSLDILS